jgi:hypothetical protein
MQKPMTFVMGPDSLLTPKTGGGQVHPTASS